MTYNVFSGTLNPTQSINLLVNVMILSCIARSSSVACRLTVLCALGLHSSNNIVDNTIIMAAVCNRGAIIFLPCGYYLSIFFSSPNLSGRRLDVYHTSTHGVALVRI